MVIGLLLMIISGLLWLLGHLKAKWVIKFYQKLYFGPNPPIFEAFVIGFITGQIFFNAGIMIYLGYLTGLLK